MDLYIGPYWSAWTCIIGPYWSASRLADKRQSAVCGWQPFPCDFPSHVSGERRWVWTTDPYTDPWFGRAVKILLLIIMYIYHALINALSAHMKHINLNMIFYTRVEHSPTNNFLKVLYGKTNNTPPAIDWEVKGSILGGSDGDPPTPPTFSPL